MSTHPAAAAPADAPLSAIALTLRHPLYRGSTLALLLSGLGVSAAAPLIASFLVRDLGASLTVAGLYYLTNLTAPIAGYLIGARSDRTGERLGYFRLCALLGGAGWLGIAGATELWVPFVISFVVLGFAGAATSQLFAALHDELSLRPSPSNDGVVAIVRMALTAGWVLGPVLGASLAAIWGFRAMLVCTAIATLAQILPLGRVRSTPIAAGSPPVRRPRSLHPAKRSPQWRTLRRLPRETAPRPPRSARCSRC